MVAITVFPLSLANFFNSLTTDVALKLSSPEVGSSRSKSDGSVNISTAMAVLFRSPPEIIFFRTPPIKEFWILVSPRSFIII